METTDQAAWDKWKSNQVDDSDYGLAIFAFAEDWADRMEAAIEGGESLEDCASRTSHEASQTAGGVTGYQAGAGASMLAKLWIHGEEFRKWWNRDCQIGDEGEKANESGGTLNPALMVVGAS